MVSAAEDIFHFLDHLLRYGENPLQLIYRLQKPLSKNLETLTLESKAVQIFISITILLFIRDYMENNGTRIILNCFHD